MSGGKRQLEKRYRIGVLLYFADVGGRTLLIKRTRPPNTGLWCAIGGKLEMERGESPYECAAREGREEVGVDFAPEDFLLRAMMAEKDYEGTGHWLMFVFQAKQPLKELPKPISEGRFGFFEHSELPGLAMPKLDKKVLLERILAEGGAALHVLRVEPGVERQPEGLVEEERLG